MWVFSGQGSQWAAMGAGSARDGAGVRRDCRRDGAADRPRVRVLGDRGDVGARDGDRDRPRPAHRVRRCRSRWPPRCSPTGCGPARSSGIRWARSPQPSSRERCRCEDGVRVICRRSRLMSRIAGSGAMASVELPASQVLSELAARGVDRCRPLRGGLAAVDGGRRRHADGSRPGGRLGAARRDGARGGRRRRLAFASGRSDPRRAGRRAGGPQPDDADDPVSTRRPCTTRASSPSGTPSTGWTICVTRCGSPRRCRRRSRTGTGCSRELAPHPLLTHAVEQTARSLDMPLAALAAHAPRAGAAARAARLPGRSAQRGRGSGLLGAVSRRAAGGRAAADLDAPSAAA